ncbi:MAG: lamin tail domain-containing protein [Bacteroidota bacterium]
MKLRTLQLFLPAVVLVACETKLVIPENPDTPPPPTTDLIISEVRVTSTSEDGGFRNTYFEVYNGTGMDVDLSDYGAWYSSNGSNGVWDESTQITFSGTLPSGEVIIVARENTNPELVDADFVWSALTANGDDGIALVKNDGGTFQIIDQYGEPYTSETDPGTGWPIAGEDDASRNTVLWRKYLVEDPNTDWTQSAGTTVIGSEWVVRDKEDYSNIGNWTPAGDDFEPEDGSGPPPPEDEFPATNDLIISEVRVTSTSEDGGFRNTYVEIYNGTGTAVDLTQYGLQYANNGNGGNWDESSQLTFEGTLDNESFLLVARENTDPDILADPDYVWGALTANGDDGVALVKNDGGLFEVIDQYGEPYDDSNDPDGAWDIAGVSEASKDFVLLRKFLVSDPNTDWRQAAGTTTVGSEWIVADKADFSNLRTFTPDTVSFEPEDPTEPPPGDTPPMTNELVISEVRVTSTQEDGFRNTYVEIYNGTGAAVDLTQYGLQYANNGNDGAWDESTQVTFDGTLENESFILVARENTNPDILVDPDYVWGSLTADGDDGVALVKDNGGTFEVIDQYGEPYDDANNPGDAWDIAGVTDASKDFVLLRKFPVMDPNTDWTQSAGTTTIGSEWIVADKEDFSNIRTFPPDTVDFTPEEPESDAPSTNDLIISEVRVTSTAEDGGFRNTYLEIYNGTGADVDLTNYAVQYASNGNSGSYDETTQLTFEGTLAHEAVIVIARSNTDPALVVDPDYEWSAFTANGDDAVGLFKDSGSGFQLIDQYGEPFTRDGADDPGNAWDIAGVAVASRDQVLWRKWTVADPSTDWTASAGTTTEDSQWIVQDKSDFSNLGTYTPKP